jgi:rhodanese-related sulfurtransferase
MDSLTLAELLETTRNRLERVRPEDLESAIEAGAAVVDIRDSAQRSRKGDLPGAYVIDLTVLEWRLASSSSTRIVDIDADQRVILVCSDGFSSSLAASRLQDLGLVRATDLVGGFAAWAALHRSPQSGSNHP